MVSTLQISHNWVLNCFSSSVEELSPMKTYLFTGFKKLVYFKIESRKKINFLEKIALETEEVLLVWQVLSLVLKRFKVFWGMRLLAFLPRVT